MKIIKIFVDAVPTKDQKMPEKGNYVVHATSPDASKYIAWDYENWEIKDYSKDSDYSVYFFSVDTLFDSADALANATGLKKGQMVGTKSYYANTGKGGAVYTIADEGEIALSDKSGFAKLVPLKIFGKTIVTPEMLGAFGDGVSFDHEQITNALNFGADTVEFESSVYLQGETIKLTKGDITVNGKGAEIHNSYKNGVVNNDFVICGKSYQEPIKDVVMEYLTLVCTEQKCAGALYNKADHIQFSASSVNSLTVRSCKFIVPEDNGGPRQVDSIWINGHKMKDITIENNYIRNYSNSGMGGGIWLSTGTGETAGSNYVIRGNYVEKNSCDEVFAAFIGEFDGILVENNCFYTHKHKRPHFSDNGLGFGVWDIPTSVKNAKFLNNFVHVAVGKNMFIFAESENIEIAGNKFFATTNYFDDETQQDTTIIARAAFRLPEPDKYELKNVTIHDNYVEVNADYVDMNGFNLCSFSEALSPTTEVYNNDVVLNCTVGALTVRDAGVYHDNTFTINGDIVNKNYFDENSKQYNNKIILNKK